MLGYAKEYNSLNVGESKIYSNSAYINNTIAPGNYYLIFKADNYEFVAESDETNNFADQSFTVTEAPKLDLTITGLTAPTSAISGNSITINYTVNNFAPQFANSSQTYFYLSKDRIFDNNDTYIGADPVNMIAAGSSSSESVSVALSNSLTSGNYYLFAKADGGNVITEFDEYNNFSYRSISLTQPARPDLVITGTSLANQSTVAAGNKLDLTYAIKNQGNSSATSSRTNFYISNDLVFDSSDTLVGFDNVGALAAGSSTARGPLSVSIGDNVIPGNYYLFFKADGLNAITESNEANNLVYTTINVTQKPDLTITSVGGPTTAAAGSTITLNYTIANQSLGFANYSYTGFYLSKDTNLDSTDTLLGSDFVSALTAGNSSAESVSLTLSSSWAAGDYYIIYRADGWGYVNESNETNNLAFKAITITQPV